MYVCTCNGLSERKVDSAIRDGADTPRAVHATCGSRPQCGRCLPEIADRLRAARVAKTGAFAAPCSVLTPAREQDEVAASA